jgi:transposase-like protein
VKFCSKEGAEHEEKSIQRRIDHWDFAGSGVRESNQGGLCDAQYQHGNLPRVEEEVWRDGSQRSQEAQSAGGGELAAQASGGRPSRADSYPQRGQRKKVVSPSARRRAVKMSVQEGIGKVAAACRALGLSRSSYYRSGRSSLESRRIRKEVLELSDSADRAALARNVVEVSAEASPNCNQFTSITNNTKVCRTRRRIIS